MNTHNTNDCIVYCIPYKDEFSLRATKGFKEGAKSDDGDWIIGNRGAQDNMWCTPRPDKLPQWIKDVLISFGLTENDCCFDGEVAKTIVNDERFIAERDGS